MSPVPNKEMKENFMEIVFCAIAGALLSGLSAHSIATGIYRHNKWPEGGSGTCLPTILYAVFFTTSGAFIHGCIANTCGLSYALLSLALTFPTMVIALLGLVFSFVSLRWLIQRTLALGSGCGNLICTALDFFLTKKSDSD